MNRLTSLKNNALIIYENDHHHKSTEIKMRYYSLKNEIREYNFSRQLKKLFNKLPDVKNQPEYCLFICYLADKIINNVFPIGLNKLNINCTEKKSK